jgi:hypothetical protein
MAGTNPSFSASTVRAALRLAMTMGAPTKVADQVTFRWTAAKTAQVPSDPAGVPYDLTVSATPALTPPDTVIPVSVRFSAAAAIDTRLGEFDPSRLVLEVIDEDYAKVIGADRILFNQNEYTIDFVETEGLFDLTMHRIYARSASTGAHNVH